MKRYNNILPKGSFVVVVVGGTVVVLFVVVVGFRVDLLDKKS